MTGIQRLKERPIRDLSDALLENGCNISFLGKEGFFPICTSGGSFPGGHIRMKANVSSQYVSSILLSAPYAEKEVELELVGEVVSQPFIDMTTQLMKQFGIQVAHSQTSTSQIYKVPLGRYQNPQEFVIESDASSGSYPLALGAIMGKEIVLDSITSHSLQGDAKFYTVLEKMGCIVEQTEHFTKVLGPENGNLNALPEIDMSSMTDCFMTVAVLAAWAKGVTKIVNIANQRVKECNRLLAMVTELRKLNIQAKELEDGIQIEGCGGNLDQLKLPASIFCYNDHRIAMSFAVLSARVPQITIQDKECVDKTYPTFWLDLENKFNFQLETPDISDVSR